MSDETSDIARTDTLEYWETCAREAESENGVLGLAVEHWHQVADTLKQQRDIAEAERDDWRIRAMQSEQQRQALLAAYDAMKARAEAAEAERDAMKGATESEKLRELERIARGNGYWNHIEPFVAAFALKSAILTCEREKWEKRARKLLRHRKALRAERDALLKDADIVRRARGRSSLVIEVTPELLTKDAFTAQPLHVMLTDNGDGTHLLTFRESEELHILRSRLKAFEKKCEAMRKDAARLDWLGKFGVRIDLPRPENSKPVWVVFSDNLTGLSATYPMANGATIREAIDAAMEAKV